MYVYVYYVCVYNVYAYNVCICNVYVCMCVCVYMYCVYVYVCIYVRMYTCIYVWLMKPLSSSIQADCLSLHVCRCTCVYRRVEVNLSCHSLITIHFDFWDTGLGFADSARQADHRAPGIAFLHLPSNRVTSYKGLNSSPYSPSKHFSPEPAPQPLLSYCGVFYGLLFALQCGDAVQTHAKFSELVIC